MKRVNHLIEKIAEPENLRLAFWKAGKGKRYATEVEKYRQNLDANLLRLREQILSGEVEVGNYRYFKIYEPKERQICASAFSEQVLHHALMNVCHEFFERKQIFDSYASRIGKGTHAAVTRARKFSGENRWFLKMDVQKFFESVHHEVVKNQLAAMFKDKCLLEIFGKIVDSFSAHPDRGLPIGNLTSQYFANHFLVELDQFIKDELRAKSYVRYMDDLVIWSNEKLFLKNALKSIEIFVQNQLRCQLKKSLVNRTILGLPFLGYRIFPGLTRLSRPSKQRFEVKIKLAEKNLNAGIWSETVWHRRVLPLLNFVQFADTQELRSKMFGQQISENFQFSEISQPQSTQKRSGIERASIV